MDNERVQKTFEQYVPNFVCRHIQKLLEQYSEKHGDSATELIMEPFCTECFGVAVMADGNINIHIIYTYILFFFFFFFF